MDPYWREPTVKGSCTSDAITGRTGPPSEPVRGCGMEARNEPQHRTRVNPCAGRLVWVSVPLNATPGIQSRQDGIGGGGGGKSCVLTLGDLLGSALSGRHVRDGEPTSGEKSDRPIVAVKPGNSGGAKGATG